MSTTTDTETSAPAQPELRVTITMPLPADAFEQARKLASIEPILDQAETALEGASIGFLIERRVVRPKPPKRAPAALAALLALLLPLAACAATTTEPNCWRDDAPHCLPTDGGETLGQGEL